MRVWCEKSGSLARAGVEEEPAPRLAAAAAGRREVRVHAVEQRRAPGGVGVAGAERADLRLLEEVVAPVQLVGALAGRDHRDALLARRARQQVQRDARGADDRRLEVEHDVLERVGDLLRPDLDHVVLRAELAGDLALEGGLVEQRIAEGERERAQLVVGLLDRERGRQARVEAAREVAADGHVGAQPQPHRVAQQLAERLGRGLGRVGRIARLPPRALLDDLAVAPHQQVAGRQQADALERAARRPRGPEREDLVDALEVGHGLDEAGGEDALDLAREDDAAVGEGRVVQRPHAEAVAHQRERARGPVEVRDAPLAVAAVQGLRAVAVEQAQQDLGVARRAEALALGLELLAELVVVEDLAVVDHHRVAVGALHGLPAGRDVEDRETRRDEPGAAAGRDAVAVRAAVADGARHAPQRRLVDRARRIGVQDARDAAHVSGRPGGSIRRCR